jgi:hypothetical protein
MSAKAAHKIIAGLNEALERTMAGEFDPPELPWLEFELPCPPSVNRFKMRLGNKSPDVRTWIGRADMAFMGRKQDRPAHLCRIKGKFEAEFLFGRNNRADFHNFEKPLFDWLQSRELIENDKLCEWRSSGWSDDVPKGRVVVRLRPWMAP